MKYTATIAVIPPGSKTKIISKFSLDTNDYDQAKRFADNQKESMRRWLGVDYALMVERVCQE